MSYDNTIGAFIAGGAEGFIAPLVETVIAILISAVITVNQTLQSVANQTNPHGGTNPFDLIAVLSLFALMILLENILIGLFGNMNFAIGYCCGAILSIFAYAGILSNVFPQASNATVGIIGLIMIGIIVRLFVAYVVESKKHANDYSYW
jgi:hypothetical protein